MSRVQYLRSLFLLPPSPLLCFGNQDHILRIRAIETVHQSHCLRLLPKGLWNARRFQSAPSQLEIVFFFSQVQGKVTLVIMFPPVSDPIYFFELLDLGLVSSLTLSETELYTDLRSTHRTPGGLQCLNI